MEAAKPHVHLLGDSTLDNVYWVMDGKKDKEAHNASVRGKLQASLGKEYEVLNHSYDGFTTTDVLNGSVIGEVLRYNTRYIQLREEEVRQIKPLEKLQQTIKAAPKATHYVVISVGGNDFRVHLNNPFKLLSEIPHVQRRYLEIVDKVKEMGDNVKPILMFQYRTDARNRPYYIYHVLRVIGGIQALINLVAFGSILYLAHRLKKKNINQKLAGGGMVLGATTLYISHCLLSFRVMKEVICGKHFGISIFGTLLEKFYQPMVRRAIADKIPILDLPNKFNPTNSDLYECEIEPSEAGGTLIAEKLAKIVRNYETRLAQVEQKFENWTVKAF